MDVALRCTIPLNAPAAAAEIVSLELFDAGAAAVGEEPQPDGSLILIGGFDSDLGAAAAARTIADRLGHLVSTIEATESPPDWAITQRATLAPTRIGRWYVRGPWDPTPVDVDAVHDIDIDPGVAFGHGGHASTRLAIELLEREAPRFDRMSDIGTGTGVLAIVAARLGLDVDAIENDVGAAAVARRNIDVNVSATDAANGQIRLVIGDATLSKVGDRSLVVANVTLDVHRAIAPMVSSAETIVASGLLCRQVQGFCSLYDSFDAVTCKTHGEWAAVTLRRRHDEPSPHSG